jgi:hypothetical protein
VCSVDLSYFHMPVGVHEDLTSFQNQVFAWDDRRNHQDRLRLPISTARTSLHSALFSPCTFSVHGPLGTTSSQAEICRDHVYTSIFRLIARLQLRHRLTPLGSATSDTPVITCTCQTTSRGCMRLVRSGWFPCAFNLT